jgi:hypothetical protein
LEDIVMRLISTILLAVVGGVILFFAVLGVQFYWYTEVKGYALTMPDGGYGEVSMVSKPRIEYRSATLMSTREPVLCEFEKPLKHVTLVNHWYTDWDELNADYITLADPNGEEHVWGWSNCHWQQEDDAAWCDIYAVVPLFVDADMFMDTLGHEVLHGACGDFHK